MMLIMYESAHENAKTKTNVSFFVSFQPGMPQTACPGTMFNTPSGFSSHLACAEPGEEEEEGAPQSDPRPGACLAEGPAITSASLDTLIQNLVPTADYYPEVNIEVGFSFHLYT